MTQEDPDTEKTERAAALYTLTSTEWTKSVQRATT